MLSARSSQDDGKSAQTNFLSYRKAKSIIERLHKQTERVVGAPSEPVERKERCERVRRLHGARRLKNQVRGFL
jgi:hypothetical protein